MSLYALLIFFFLFLVKEKEAINRMNNLIQQHDILKKEKEKHVIVLRFNAVFRIAAELNAYFFYIK
jgi:hypothetical protein